MKTEKKRKFDGICVKGKNTDRPNLQQPYLDADAGLLYACNGFALAVVPVSNTEEDSSGPVPLDAIKTAGKSKIDRELTAPIHVNGGTVKVEDATTTSEFMVSPLAQNVPYPNIEQVIKENNPGPDVVHSVALDAKLLFELAKALCTDGGYKVVLYLEPTHPRTRTVHVKPIQKDPHRPDNKAFGIIMPVWKGE